MSDREDFFSRWSRRKREAAESANEPKQSDGEARAKSGDAPMAQNAAADPTGPAFNPATLPSIESITAETDIRGFLAPSVPPALMRAALRRVWTTELKIRDFVGLADYDWDFNAPGSMAGFGALESTDAIRQQMADLIGRDATEDSDRCSRIAEANPVPRRRIPVINLIARRRSLLKQRTHLLISGIDQTSCLLLPRADTDKPSRSDTQVASDGSSPICGHANSYGSNCIHSENCP